MVLADTSVWIDHLRIADPQLTRLLRRGEVYIHPWIIGELACGHLTPREKTIQSLKELPQLLPARPDEVLVFIDANRLMGRGIGYVDLHLLAAVKQNGATIWTRDKRLLQAAIELKLAHIPPPALVN